MTEHVTTHQAQDDIRNQSILIYVDGKIVPRDQAVVSVYDSGFMLGDGVWEGMRLYNGKWAFLDEHMDRLFEAAKAIDLDIWMDRKGVISALLETQKANGMTENAHARLMITRGVKVLPFQHPSLSQSHNPCHCAAFARLADDPRSETEQSFQAKLHPCLYRRAKGGRG